MKIGILRRQYVSWGGGERFTHRFVQALVERGHEVHLFCHGWRDSPAGVQVHRVPRLGPGALGMFGFAVLAPVLARRARMDLVHGFDRTFHQDVFRAGEGCHRQWLALRARARGRARQGTPRPLHRAILQVERAIARGRAARVLEVNSRMVEDDFRRHYGALGARVALVRNAVDLERYSPERRRRRRDAARAGFGVGEAVALLVVASGLERKGIPAAVGALARLRRGGVRALLLLCGKLPAPAVRALAAAAGIGGDVRHLGELEDPMDAYAAADVFVLPTLYDPASNATLEALASGVPVITTTRNGTSEILEHGISGWLLDDPADADGLQRLLVSATDTGARAAVGAAGRKAVEPWTWARYVEDTLALYASLTRTGYAGPVR